MPLSLSDKKMAGIRSIKLHIILDSVQLTLILLPHGNETSGKDFKIASAGSE